jgi:ABC-type phosphate transport system permease subunit
MVVEDERRSLLGIGQVAGETAVVLAGHHPVESDL